MPSSKLASISATWFSYLKISETTKYIYNYHLVGLCVKKITLSVNKNKSKFSIDLKKKVLLTYVPENKN
jgi:hypothetical protein